MERTAKQFVFPVLKPIMVTAASLALATGTVTGLATLAMAAKYRAAAERIVVTSPNASACESAIHALVAEKLSWVPGVEESEMMSRCTKSSPRVVKVASVPEP